MKKFCVLLLSICLMISFCFSVNANDVITGNSNYTVIFADDSCFDEYEQKEIIELLVGDTNEGVATYNLLCTLFGHNWETEFVTVIRHKVYDAEPRCIEELYEVGICSRCSDAKTTLSGRSASFCCPEGT